MTGRVSFHHLPSDVGAYESESIIETASESVDDVVSLDGSVFGTNESVDSMPLSQSTEGTMEGLGYHKPKRSSDSSLYVPPASSEETIASEGAFAATYGSASVVQESDTIGVLEKPLDIKHHLQTPSDFDMDEAQFDQVLDVIMGVRMMKLLWPNLFPLYLVRGWSVCRHEF